ncbi:AtpZ/AtpI family protein [Alkalibacter rhizosphaerae]|uniref:AtpZ/AtpI family protein n=1 Tax=Alkalibacter rhizosphaerae TaxID=2815577 RepID=A0A974XEV3_9FIRM|nr:AtpZ/AtpI family protein [Alkalibacter rhizosphaerae]QSX08533.1 AtpZ/AtpI family protein [Alkalibacter rhizosphaerae]
MADQKKTPDEELNEKIAKQANSKIRSKKEGNEIAFGMGVFGIIGWSIAIPTLLGVALGSYLDERFTQSFSWTLSLLFFGLIVGCFNAWRWLKERSERK